MTKRYINLRLCIEESGIVEGSGLYAVRYYTIHDPSGLIGGELDITCRAVDLEGKLKILAPLNVNSTTATRVTSYEKKKPLDVPTDVSAGGLLNDIAERLGVSSETTRFFSELVDDALTKRGQ